MIIIESKETRVVTTPGSGDKVCFVKIGIIELASEIPVRPKASLLPLLKSIMISRMQLKELRAPIMPCKETTGKTKLPYLRTAKLRLPIREMPIIHVMLKIVNKESSRFLRLINFKPASTILEQTAYTLAPQTKHTWTLLDIYYNKYFNMSDLEKQEKIDCLVFAHNDVLY